MVLYIAYHRGTDEENNFVGTSPTIAQYPEQYFGGP
jgi:hypothetical protein